MVTKLNVNIRTLLSNCEELAKDELNYWRLKKYIKSLDTMICELLELEDSESTQKIPNYIKRLEALKVITNYVDSPTTDATNKSKTNSFTSNDTETALKEVIQLNASKREIDKRKELMNEDNLRRRKQDNNSTMESMNDAVQYYSEAQEKITEHLLALTRNLKEQTETANRIIKKDTSTVALSTTMTDRNISSLQKETERLEDQSRNAWKCWMWLMFAFVIVVFIGMVLFMKITKKRIL